MKLKLSYISQAVVISTKMRTPAACKNVQHEVTSSGSWQARSRDKRQHIKKISKPSQKLANQSITDSQITLFDISKMNFKILH